MADDAVRRSHGFWKTPNLNLAAEPEATPPKSSTSPEQLDKRICALTAAIKSAPPGTSFNTVLTLAEKFEAWLDGTEDTHVVHKQIEDTD